MKIIITEDQLKYAQSLRRRYNFLNDVGDNVLLRINPCFYQSFDDYASEFMLEFRDRLSVNYFDDKSFGYDDLFKFLLELFGDKMRVIWDNRKC